LGRSPRAVKPARGLPTLPEPASRQAPAMTSSIVGRGSEAIRRRRRCGRSRLAQEFAEGSDRQQPVQQAVRPGRMLQVPEPFTGRTAPELTSKRRGSSAFAHEPHEALAAVAHQISHEDDIPGQPPSYPRVMSLS
jgi:hypothetical protein